MNTTSTTATALRTVLLAVLALSLSATKASAQRPRPAVFSPAPMRSGSTSTAVGVSVWMLPKELVGETASQLPMLEWDTRIGLPGNCSAHIGVSGAYLVNRVTAGLAWSSEFGPVTLSTGVASTFWFGFMPISGFDASASGFIVNPYVTVGADLGTCLVTMKNELLFAQSSNATVGTTSMRSRNHGVNGVAITLSLEKELFAGVDVVVGARMQYAQPSYTTWMTFSNSGSWSLSPNFYIGYVL